MIRKILRTKRSKHFSGKFNLAGSRLLTGGQNVR